MLSLDLSIPFAILTVALVIVLSFHAWLRLERRRRRERTEAILAASRDDGSMTRREEAHGEPHPSRRDA